MSDYTMHVISHTHWDREWYLTFQQFRMKLVDLMDNLLEILDQDPDFKYFNLDGQTIVLEDYLQIKPEKRKIIEEHVKSGRILIGPWYQLNDEFLVSGESTIRSLLIGHRIAREFGPVMKLGYLPDQFGNISQMPQILNGFGVDSAIFGRGRQLKGDHKMEFTWKSPDGSQVLASLMAFWYNNAQHFPGDTETAVAYTNTLKNQLAPISAVDHLLLMNGVDHLEAQPDVGGIIKRVNEKLEGDTLVHSTLTAYMDGVKESIKNKDVKLEEVTGELREDRWNNILAGTLSSRIYLKQANEQSQTALEKYAEPASSFAYLLGNEYPQGFLTYAWKLLMQNHPHDSICGCSVDQVHKEMMPRFEQVQQVTEGLTNRALGTIADRVKTEGESIVVFNTLNWTRSDKVRAEIDFELGERTRTVPTIDPARNVDAIKILDEDGNDVPFALVETKTFGKQITDPHELPLVAMTKRFTVEFVAENVPSCGYRTYQIEKTRLTPTWKDSLTSEAYWDNALVNEYLRLSVRDGALSLEMLAGPEEDAVEAVYANWNVFEDMGDAGDEYNYVKPVNDLKVTTLGSSPEVSIVDRSPVSATFKLDWNLTIPASANADSTGRSDETTSLPITSYLTLTRGVPRVDVKTVINNSAKDHRLRVLFPTGIDADVSYAEGQFDVLEREIGVPEDWPMASTFHPQQRWVDVTDGERGLCIINKGLTEYELYNDQARTLAVTLLRCVGRLSGGADAPGAELTPGAQCIGEYSFEYSIFPHAGSWDQAQVWKQAYQHNVPMLTLQTGSHEGDLPKRAGFVETSHPELIISAMKKAEDSDMLVIRFWNPTSEVIEDAWVKVAGANGAKLLNLNEEITGDVAFENGSAILDVEPKKIITLGFELT